MSHISVTFTQDFIVCLDTYECDLDVHIKLFNIIYELMHIKAFNLRGLKQPFVFS